MSQIKTYQPDTTSYNVYSADGLPMQTTTATSNEPDIYYHNNGEVPPALTRPNHESSNCSSSTTSQQSHANATPFYPSNNLVVVENPRYVNLGTRKSVTLTYCPQCAKEHISTHTHTKATGVTWVCVVAGVFIFWPLCWLPLVITPMKQTNHYCDGCGAKVGRVKPFQ